MKSPERIGAELAGMIQGNVHIDIYNRAAFSTDSSIYQILPQCVIAPKDEIDVVAAVRYAIKNNLPIVPRGAGSGVAGESLTGGIVLDVRRYMDQVIQTAADGSWVTVQPGIVLDELNRILRPFNRMIGPDPSSSNRATVGGCLANNATGAHSLKYGYFADFVERVRAVSADGTVSEFVNNVKPDESDDPAETAPARQCIDLLAGKEEFLSNAQPLTERNRSGYNIAGVVHDGGVDMAKLMAGSEGTLAIFTEITLQTVEIPACKVLIQFEFDSFEKMTAAVTKITECGAAACELMDQRLMAMARQAHPHYSDILPADCKATLMAEFTGSGTDAVVRQMQAAKSAVAELAMGVMDVVDEKQQTRLWKSRKDAVPLLNRQKGPAHPIPFIEDVSVDPVRLGEYIEGLERIGEKHAIAMAYYGHAGDGELHIRPYIDLSVPEGIERMQAVAEEVFGLAWSLGGSISGEHADGLVRAAFIERQFGKEYYELLKGIKQIFDPAGILNPGKILNDDPQIMGKNLRTPGGDLHSEHPALILGSQEFRFEAEQCSGCGVCLSQARGTRMCPVFRGLNEELATSRGKANLLRLWSNHPDTMQPFDKQALQKILSLCVNCKMCSIQCPAGVDISKIIIEARSRLARDNGFRITELALAHNRRLSLIASTFSPLSNWVMALPITRFVMEITLGFDSTRCFPRFERGSLIRKGQKYLKGQPRLENPVDHVVYFVDSYANWNDHELGMTVIQLLRKLNVEVIIPPQRPAPLPAYVYGNLTTARKDLEYNCRQLIPYVRKGYTVVCSEPSAALCLRDEMKYLVDTEESRQIGRCTMELMQYLGELEKRGILGSVKRNENRAAERLGYHLPCHLQVLRTDQSTVDLLGRFDIEAADMNGGCCGLSGTSGMQKKNHDMSEAIGTLLGQTIREINPECVVTECAACAMQIKHLTGKPVIHPVKLIAKQILFEN